MSNVNLQTIEEAEKVLNATQARQSFSEVVDEAYHERVVYIRKHRKEVAVVPADLIRRLIELEAMAEAVDAQKALEEYDREGGTSLDDLEKELGID